MQKTCKNCEKAFTVYQNDLDFYKHISPVFNGEKLLIPPPTLCPDCRRQRRMSFRNERNLYARKCDLTGQNIISVYSPDKPFKIFHHSKWESDSWDPMDFGRDYDPNTSFFEQFNKLQQLVPKKALHIPDNMINCDYCNYGGNAQNCYLCFAPFESQNCLYSRVPYACQSDVDGEADIMCQYCYECVSCVNCYECRYCQFCENCKDSAFLIDCTACDNCFGCVGQKHKRHMFLNRQLSQEEYEEKTKDIFSSSVKLQEFEEEFAKVKQQAVYKYARSTQIENSTGDVLRGCKNCFDSYDLFNQEDSRYCELGGEQTHHAYDTTIAGLNMVNAYEQIGALGCHDSAFLVYVDTDQNCYYCISCRNCSHCFGCEGLKRKQYCILNKQYDKKEYERLVNQIVKDMIKREEWGEFFPAKISPYAYNESLAYSYFPLGKEAVQSKGLKWKDIPDNVQKASANEDIKACLECKKHYKLIQQEKDFYKKYRLPEPEKCPDCRYKKRLSQMPPMQFWQRGCMAEGCENTFVTSYSPNRLEVIYCEECYLKTIY
ncbi:hypothetical protein HY605_06085 [Candidatus Peregrinibacteria bacterium]|nr:hypothetical protein [Candidatus Peregrinibacteria bacterium]